MFHRFAEKLGNELGPLVVVDFLISRKKIFL